MGDKVLFWISVLASVSYIGNLIMLASGHSFSVATIAVSFVSNVMLYGLLALGTYLGSKQSKEKSE